MHTPLAASSAPDAELADQLARLPADTRWLLLIAAADEEMDATCLVQAARADDLDITVLTPAELAGLVRITGGQVTFPRPAVRTVVYERAPLAQRREAHLRVAEATAACAAMDRASTALVRAAELTCEPSEARARLVTAAHYAWRAGAPARARRLLRQARTTAPDGGHAGEDRLITGEIELRSGSVETAVDHLLAAADMLAETRRDLAVRALLRASEAVCYAGCHPRFGEIAARTGALRRPVDGPELEVAFAHLEGFAATFTGRHARAGEPLRRCVQLGTQLDDPTTLLMASAASMLLADHPQAWRLATGAVEAARVAGDRSVPPVALLLKAQAEYWLGRYADAEGTCRAGARVAADSGQHNYLAEHLGMLAVLAAIRGDEAACQHWMRELVIPPGSGQRCRPVALRRWAVAVRDASAGRAAEAAAGLMSIADQHTGEGQVALQLMAAPWLVEAAARGPDTQTAAQVLAAFDRWAGSTGGPLVQALSARCHALLAPRGSDRAEELFGQALRWHAEGGSEFEWGRTELLFGQELRRCRRPRDAREHLHHARDIFRQLDLTSWVERAAIELRAAGEQVEATGAAQLTAQQREIARLVAGGATNREVAAQLFLSPRTVDHHLRNIFHRLQIRSRVELARLLPPDPDTPESPGGRPLDQPA